MRVFVAGASGAIGRPLVPKLVGAGHEVTGMTRSEARAGQVRAAGGDAAVVDVFDAEALRAAIDSASPEVIVHELTSLPDRIDFRKADTYAATNRVRTEGTRNLIDAARAAGARHLWLGVWERNPRARRFYEKCGFVDVGSQAFVLGSDPQTDRVMVTTL
jgi:nucleoside-diphosphate-sugar epimerase